MKSSVGKPSFPIWLLGDSEPKNWSDQLKYPLDSRHPARHNIWTPIENHLQQYFYRNAKKSLNFENIYIRNAIKDAGDKPTRNIMHWGQNVESKIVGYKILLRKYRPRIIITFGSFAYEFLRRAKLMVGLKYGHWSAFALGNKFKASLTGFDKEGLIIVPLLHVSIARGDFLKQHHRFVNDPKYKIPNYFEYVSQFLGEFILNNFAKEKIWI